MYNIRTRFAPSPTGSMHIGNLRTALYSYLLAKHNNGTFVLRIEDTDQKRYVEGATDIIYSTLKQTNLSYDEGPDIGGEYGPYIQTQRLDIYKKYAHQLIEEGFAYYCFCEKQDNEHTNEHDGDSDYAGYNRHCRTLSQEEVQKNLSEGKPYVIRQKIPLTGNTTYHDELLGDITTENSVLDDQVLIKSDGIPTYNFANVIDDHLMNITHILRGREYISSTPKFELLYKSFGWKSPKVAHVSVIMGQNADGSVSKLSKRHGAMSFAQLVEQGYLPEAIINYIALLGWSPKQEREIFSLEELVELFDISGLVKTNSVFDYKKLAWVNGEYIRMMTPKQFYEYSLPYAKNLPAFIADKWEFVSTLLQSRINVFTEIQEKVSFLYNYEDFDLVLLENKKNKTTIENSLQLLQDSIDLIQANTDFTPESLQADFNTYSEKNEIKIGKLMWPLRVAVTGQIVTPGGGAEMIYILGKQETLARLNLTIDRIRAYNAQNEQ